MRISTVPGGDLHEYQGTVGAEQRVSYPFTMNSAHSRTNTSARTLNPARSAAPLLFRKPRRITVTVPDQIYRSLLERSSREGRSISNLAAFLLERAVTETQPAVPSRQIQG